MARNTDLTPALKEKLLNALSNGVPIADACAFVGISDRTYYYWMAKGKAGRKGHEYLVQFFQEATRARVNARVGAVATIAKSIQKGNTDDARWFLERSDPENWGRKDKLTIEAGIPVDLINEFIRAAIAAERDPVQVFQKFIEKAHAEASARPTD